MSFVAYILLRNELYIRDRRKGRRETEQPAAKQGEKDHLDGKEIYQCECSGSNTNTS